MTIADGLPQPRRFWAMTTVCLGVFLTSIDSVIANIALPTIVADLHTSAAATVWVVTAYGLAVTMCILPFAALGEIFGCRRVYLAGLCLFTLASLGCAVAGGLPALVAFRMAQGVGGAGLVSVSLALLRFIYPRDRLGRGLALYATMVAIAMSAGPSVAAAILSVTSWPWLFAVNVPIGALAILVGYHALPETPRTGRRLDVTAALLNAAALGLLVVGVDGLGEAASRPLAVVELVVAGLLGTVLIRQQRRKTRPMVPVDLFRIKLFALSALTSTFSYTCLLLSFVALPFWLQHIAGLGAAATGLLITPWPLGIMLAAPLSGRLSDRFPAGILASAGLLVMAAGLGFLLLLPPNAGYADIAWRMAMAGLGFGFFQTPNNRALMTAGPLDRSGAASGALATCRLLGMSLGAALAALVFGLAHGAAGAAPAIGLALAVALVGAAISLGRLALPHRQG
jgi:DHA2 family multidrug resistance protein-like MFS transporter